MRSTRLGEFIAALPDDVVCDAPVFGVHDYAGNGDPVGPVFDCPGSGVTARPHPGDLDHRDRRQGAALLSREDACRAVHRSLVRYYRDPRVTAAFQYTLREDDLFPTGLVSTDLERALPALGEWQAWGARPDPATPAPPETCPS